MTDVYKRRRLGEKLFALKIVKSFSRFLFSSPLISAHTQLKAGFVAVLQCAVMMFALQYGDVLNILISSKKRGSAVVEFASVKAAVSVIHLCKISKHTTVWKQNSSSVFIIPNFQMSQPHIGRITHKHIGESYNSPKSKENNLLFGFFLHWDVIFWTIKHIFTKFSICFEPLTF